MLAKKFGAMVAQADGITCCGSGFVLTKSPVSTTSSGASCVHPADNCSQESRFGVFLEMKIADLHDLHAGERIRQPGQGDREVDDFEFVARDFTGSRTPGRRQSPQPAGENFCA